MVSSEMERATLKVFIEELKDWIWIGENLLRLVHY